MPKMTHPDSKRPIEVAADQVPMYLSQGWEKAPSGSKNTTTKEK